MAAHQIFFKGKIFGYKNLLELEKQGNFEWLLFECALIFTKYLSIKIHLY